MVSYYMRCWLDRYVCVLFSLTDRIRLQWSKAIKKLILANKTLIVILKISESHPCILSGRQTVVKDVIVGTISQWVSLAILITLP